MIKIFSKVRSHTHTHIHLEYLSNQYTVNRLGINMTCTTAARAQVVRTVDTVHSNPPTIEEDVSAPPSPTSDFLDDSCVSEDNTSSVNSCSDQGISIYSTETSPVTYHYTNASSHIQENNNSIQKNRNHLMPTSTTQTIHLSPGGTMIDYKTANLQSKINAALQSSSTASPMASSSTVTTVITSTTSSPITHQHFHKKYLREEHNKQLKQVPLAPVTHQISYKQEYG